MAERPYLLDAQIGFLLRRATQRHLSIFAAHLPDLTPTQFAALAKLSELGPTSQNQLGRETAMDAATIKGVIDRLSQRGLVTTGPDAQDRRRLIVALSADGAQLWADLAQTGHAISEETLAALSPTDRETVLDLLAKLA